MERFREMLEHMSNVGIVVVSKAEHTVLYANRTFCRAYPAAETGICMGRFWGENITGSGS